MASWECTHCGSTDSGKVWINVGAFDTVHIRADGTMVGIAQLVEHLVVVQDVAGSSPVTHPVNPDRSTCPGFLYAVTQPRLPRLSHAPHLSFMPTSL